MVRQPSLTSSAPSVAADAPAQVLPQRGGGAVEQAASPVRS